ncbi:MAG TPA: NfeD family protein [Stellaceae bacterium]|nr:NfeD family protein [Stellaceae bacterium]
MAWIWAIGALFLALVELHSPGMYLIWIAAGAAITAFATLLFDLPPEGQLVVFAASAPLSCVAGYFVYRRAIRRSRAARLPNQRDRTLVGEHGTVAEPIRDGRGKIRLGDTVWLAEGPDLPQGAPVVVKALRGTTAIVAAVE